MRVQGGTLGLLNAFWSGRLDPCDPDDPPPERLRFSTNADWRMHRKRTSRRAKKAARAARVAEGVAF